MNIVTISTASRPLTARSLESHLNHLLETLGKTAANDYRRLRIRALPSLGSAMAYFELGDPNGTPLLCLHGLSVSGFYFDQFHEYFTERRVRAIAPCLLGGISIADSTRTLGHLSAELAELLDVIGVNRFDIIGFSWGTLPELALLVSAPARIRRAAFVGPVLPTRFVSASEIERMKSDVRMSLAMVRRAPAVHRCLMRIVCRLPVSVLVNQLRDPSLSAAEVDALVPASPFARHLSRCMDECRRTGSQFFTDGWRMLHDEPPYALSALSSPTLRADVRFYVGEHDNVHLPSFARTLAAARCGIEIDDLQSGSLTTRSTHDDVGAGRYRRVFSAPRCSIWMVPGAGRMACMLYLEEALEHLISADRSQQLECS